MISIPTTKNPIARLIRLVALAILSRVSRLNNRSSISIFDCDTGANRRLKLEVAFIGAFMFAFLYA